MISFHHHQPYRSNCIRISENNIFVIIIILPICNAIDNNKHNVLAIQSIDCTACLLELNSHGCFNDLVIIPAQLLENNDITPNTFMTFNVEQLIF